MAEVSHKTGERHVWRSGGGRRLALAFVFLLLLPFYISLGPMLFQRASRGLVGDTLGLALLGLVFTLLMGLLLHQLVHAVRTHVAVDDSGTHMTVPAVENRGPFVLFKYASHEIPHADVAAVETRSEVYGGSLAPVLLKSTRVALKNGRQVVLGYTNTNCSDDPISFPEIGAAIAHRAGVPVIDHGVVRRSLQQRVMGLVTTPDAKVPLPVDEIERLNGAHTRNLRILVAVLAVLVAGGIAADYATAYRTAFAGMGAGVAQPAPAKKR